jgi:hypothetical protein
MNWRAFWKHLLWGRVPMDIDRALSEHQRAQQQLTEEQRRMSEVIRRLLANAQGTRDPKYRNPEQ